MNPFEMVVLIVAIVSVASVIRAKHGVVRRKGEDVYVGPARDDEDAERLRGEVRQLRDRIQVLERIVTDGDTRRAESLEREIDALRLGREESK